MTDYINATPDAMVFTIAALLAWICVNVALWLVSLARRPRRRR